MAKIVLKDLWKIYGGKVQAVKGINLTIEDGEFFCFLGPSGCGKTSTMRMIAGIEEISDGEIYIDDVLVNKLPPSKRDVAMAFETYALYPPLNVRENLAFPMRVRGMARDEIDREVDRVAKLLDLSSVLDRKPAHLSGGQQQRVSLGRCIARPAKAYLFDEPLSHVDSKSRLRMRAEIKRLQETLNTTAIYVTHDQLEALALGDRIMVMNDGEIQQVGTPEEVYNQPWNLFVADFIGEPPFNFFDGTLSAEGDEVFFNGEKGGMKVALPPHIKEKVNGYIDKTVRLGIRPRYMVPTLTEPEESHARGQVWVFEDLGEHGILTIQLGDDSENLIRIMTESDFGGRSGDPVWLSLQTEHAHVFDPESGQNLLFAR